MEFNKAFTFDDIVILPEYSDIEREDVDISSNFYQHDLAVPIFSSPMDTITEIDMMKAIYKAGGLGFHHRYVLQNDQLLQNTQLAEAALVPGGIAVSPSMRVDDIIDTIVNDAVLILDVAHGHTTRNVEFCASLVKNGFAVISGNIVTPQAIEAYLNVGVRDFRVGIGSGSVCTTRTVAGVGMPQASAIRTLHELRDEFRRDVTLISDGGHKTTADIVKALALGADFVMLGGMLAGCNEVPEKGKNQYRGMASRDARNGIGKLDCVPEGITKDIQPTGRSVADILHEIKGAIELACYYVGARNLNELREAEIIFVTEHGYREGLTR